MQQKRSFFTFFRRELRKHSYFKQLFCTYTFISCLLFFLFSILIIYYINEDYKSTLIEVQEQTIEQSHELNQTVLQDIYSTCYTLMDDADLPRVLYNSEYTTTMALTAQKLHNQIRQTSSIIHSVYFVNYRTGMVMDNYSRVPIETHYDAELFAYLENHEPSKTPTYGVSRKLFRKSSSFALTNVPVFSIIYYASSRGALVVNIDYNAYAQLLQLKSSDYLEWIQISRDGQVIAASDFSLFGTDYAANDVYAQIAQRSDRCGSFSWNLNGTDCRIAYQHNSGLGITYLSIFNHSALYTANHLLWVVFLCGIAFILIGMIVTFCISIFVYRPFRNFKEQLAESSSISIAPQTADTDDFTYLSNIYRDITSANLRLQNLSHTWLKEKDRRTLKQLMTNSAANQPILPEQYESLNQYFEKECYQVVLISIDYQSRQDEDANSINLLKYAITNVMNELFEPDILFMNIDIISPNVIYLINHDDADGQKLRSILVQGQEFLQTNFKITLSMGIGEAVSELDEISFSYTSAQDALSQRFLTGNSSIHFASERKQPPLARQHYPYSADNAIISAMKALDQNELALAMKQFYDAICQFHMDQIIRSILQLDAALQRFENSQNLTGQFLPWELNTLAQLDIRTIFENLYARCLLDMDELDEIKNHSTEKPELIQDIIRMVDDNLSNPNLSVAFLAGEVHLSINYLRSIFKENTGESLSNYITQKKIDLICRLLTETDTSIQDISDQLGFSTKNYFFTFFKKHMKVTPNEYRKAKMETQATRETRLRG
ncbi:MAG: AraC family transcriptional regulator [Lachnospiraceae bacterium]|nr:AraC family transcriptional regulator [Lachnospiraceae bacterium]